MMSVYILPKAMLRLEEIYDYYSLFNEQTAARIYNDILDEIGVLERFPRIGPVELLLDDCGKEFRYLVVLKHFKVIYFVEDADNAVYVATIWDCRQDPQNIRWEVR
jgi:plasmid stabilization system protein ParE